MTCSYFLFETLHMHVLIAQQLMPTTTFQHQEIINNSLHHKNLSQLCHKVVI